MAKSKHTGLLHFILFAFVHQVALADQIVVKARDVNGSWENFISANDKTKPMDGLYQRWNIWALGHQKLQVEFLGYITYDDASGTPTASEGFTEGIAEIKGNIATLRPVSSDPDCQFVLTFERNALSVTQENCAVLGFGNGVGAVGTYKRTSSKRPVFDKLVGNRWR